MENFGLGIHLRHTFKTELQEPDVYAVEQKQEECLSYLSKGNRVVEESMGLVDRGW